METFKKSKKRMNFFAYSDIKVFVSKLIPLKNAL